MPTYEYECGACQHRLEAMQSISAKPLRKCPKCGKSRLQRLISKGGGLIFKGSGFYITDYRGGDYKAKAEADKKPVAAASSGDAKSASDAKPASAPPTTSSSPASDGKKSSPPTAPTPSAKSSDAKPSSGKKAGKA